MFHVQGERMTENVITTGDLIDELSEYPRDTPIWPQLMTEDLPLPLFMMLDFEFSQYASLDGGASHQLHLVFKKSSIYNEVE